jgi:ParB-like chromosome segregation protein Spo0J
MGNKGIVIEEMDVSAVSGNKILALSADRETVERCKAAISRFGALTPPVVAALPDGRRAVLSGEPEFAAIRETGAQTMAAVTARVPDGEAAKASLLLSSLRKSPGALCEGLLLNDAIAGGATRVEIGGMLSRSPSWVSNRLALATRLDSGVREMLERGMLDARSAQEVARLPIGKQHGFALKVVRDGMPKSAVEELVASYNDKHCPEAAREQILRDPQAALPHAKGRRRASRGHGGIAKLLIAARAPLSNLASALCFASPSEASGCWQGLKELEKDLEALLEMARRLIYPGKKEARGAN